MAKIIFHNVLLSRRLPLGDWTLSWSPHTYLPVGPRFLRVASKTCGFSMCSKNTSQEWEQTAERFRLYDLLSLTARLWNSFLNLHHRSYFSQDIIFYRHNSFSHTRSTSRFSLGRILRNTRFVFTHRTHRTLSMRLAAYHKPSEDESAMKNNECHQIEHTQIC